MKCVPTELSMKYVSTLVPTIGSFWQYWSRHSQLSDCQAQQDCCWICAYLGVGRPFLTQQHASTEWLLGIPR